MTRLISLFGGTVTDTDVQVVKENQVIIAYSAGMNQYRLVVYKIEHTKNGYIYHLINQDSKEFTSTEIINPLSRKFGIGKYYDDINPEFMDAFEVVVLRQEAEGKANAKAVAYDFTIVGYSEKSVAIFGDTKAIKEQLAALGGRFNKYLTQNGQKSAGWVFPKSKEPELRQLININHK